MNVNWWRTRGVYGSHHAHDERQESESLHPAMQVTHDRGAVNGFLIWNFERTHTRRRTFADPRNLALDEFVISVG